MTERTPSTEAGREVVSSRWDDTMQSVRRLNALVVKVEAEAESSLRARLAAEVRAIRPPDRFVAMDGTWEQGLSEAAVLRVIEPESDGGTL